MKRYQIFIFLLIFISELNANNFEHLYKIGNFKIFYTLNGKNKLPIYNQVDNNKNKIPDYIEDIAVQLNNVSKLFSSLNFTNPLDSKRYKNKAFFISVTILDMKNNGKAFDGINKANKRDKEKLQPSLAINLSNKLNPKSLTPLHEYFHLIQNGYTMFKNRWYTEGTARWSESILRDDLKQGKKLPSSTNELKIILSQTYKTSLMWNRLAYLLDKDSCYKNNICGAKFMQIFLENLAKYDKLMSQKMNYLTYNWKESNQKSSINDKYILMALSDVVKSSKSTDIEIQNFLKVIDDFTLP
ncbi:hypothetical protein [Sulfurimonas sp.]